MTISFRDKVLVVFSAVYFLIVAAIVIRTGYDVQGIFHDVLLYAGVPLVAVWGLRCVGSSRQVVFYLSVLWFVLIAYFTIIDDFDVESSVSDLLFIGIVPLVVIWGGKWIFLDERKT